MFKHRILVLLVSLLWVYANAQYLENNFERGIDSLVNRAMADWHIPGCAIALVKGQDLVYCKGYGFRNVEEKLPVTPNTVFKIASLTKSFTAAAAGILVHQRLMEWDRPVKEYVPNLKLADQGTTREATVRDFLSHRTGIYDDDWSWVGDHIDRKRMFEILEVMPQKSPFRGSFIYNNLGYALIGQVMADRSQQSWRQLIRRDFIEPLSLRSTGFSHNERSGWKDFAYGYEWIDSSKSYKRGDLSEHLTDSLSVCEPFAFISTTATDLSAWVRLFINGGIWKGKEIIPGDVYRELLSPQNLIDTSGKGPISNSYYCMGWIRSLYREHTLIQHSGGLTGFKTFMSFMPADSTGVVVLTNGQAYAFPMALTLDLYDLLMNLQRGDWCLKWLAKKPKEEKDVPVKPVKYADMPPSKPLQAFAGTYHSQWLGDIRISLENGRLYFSFHHYPNELMKHAHYNTFFTEKDWEPGKGITFQLNHDGEVASLQLNEFSFDKIK